MNDIKMHIVALNKINLFNCITVFADHIFTHGDSKVVSLLPDSHERLTLVEDEIHCNC